MITVDLKTVCIVLLAIFIIMEIYGVMIFIKAIFKFPTFRAKVWHGITNGDDVPHLDDFQRTSQLLWSYVFGSGIVICILLWIAFPENAEWKWITGSVGAIFLACIGLKTITGLFKH
ncbi:MAG TPA: hypothetical protein VK589_11915 [Chryseolinea sp.]|nr:hypothetical protein [Chryseolinea sp.]